MGFKYQPFRHLIRYVQIANEVLGNTACLCFFGSKRVGQEGILGNRSGRPERGAIRIHHRHIGWKTGNQTGVAGTAGGLDRIHYIAGVEISPETVVGRSMIKA